MCLESGSRGALWLSRACTYRSVCWEAYAETRAREWRRWELSEILYKIIEGSLWKNDRVTSLGETPHSFAAPYTSGSQVADPTVRALASTTAFPSLPASLFATKSLFPQKMRGPWLKKRLWTRGVLGEEEGHTHTPLYKIRIEMGACLARARGGRGHSFCRQAAAPARSAVPPAPAVAPMDVDAAPVEAHRQVETRNRDGKKRIRPVLVTSTPSAHAQQRSALTSAAHSAGSSGAQRGAQQCEEAPVPHPNLSRDAARRLALSDGSGGRRRVPTKDWLPAPPVAPALSAYVARSRHSGTETSRSGDLEEDDGDMEALSSSQGPLEQVLLESVFQRASQCTRVSASRGGQPLWHALLQGTVSQLAGRDKFAILGLHDGTLHVLDADSGAFTALTTKPTRVSRRDVDLVCPCVEKRTCPRKRRFFFFFFFFFFEAVNMWVLLSRVPEKRASSLSLSSYVS